MKSIKSIFKILAIALLVVVLTISMAKSDGDVNESLKLSQQLSEIKKSEIINGHESVDLGLPSGVKWATCNIGASSPEELGNYYAWGETQPKSKYTESNSLTFGKSIDDLQSAGIIVTVNTEWLPRHILTPEYDAAHVNWGGSWRLPTAEEIHELLESCSWNWKSQKGCKGFEVTGPNGNSIFLPVGGIRCDDWEDDDRFYGNTDFSLYWSANRSGEYEDVEFGFCLELKDKYPDWEGYRREWGCQIRPVSD